MSGLKDAGRASEEYIFRSYNIYFQCYAFWSKSFRMPVRKRRQKGLKSSNFVLLWSFSNGIMAVKGLNYYTVSVRSVSIVPIPLWSPVTRFRFVPVYQTGRRSNPYSFFITADFHGPRVDTTVLGGNTCSQKLTVVF